VEDLVALATRRPATQWVGRPLLLESSTASTNDDARDAARGGAASGYTIVADTQTAGRGRRGRTWISPPGENLYLSVVARPRLSAERSALITLAAGLAVRDAVVQHIEPERVTIKWPNDVRVDGRKVAGVLVEGAVRGAELSYAIIGIGVNVRGERVADELEDRATTMRRARGGRDLSRADVLEALLVALEKRIEQLLRDGAPSVVRDVAAYCDTIGTHVNVEGVAGRATGISESGGLWIEKVDGDRVEVRAGEVI
jgi:BirA family biotin operon repressor/biotin-[acetyl-CoA-carboxylase] ligase